MGKINIKDLYKSYYIGKDEFPVLKGVEMEFEAGEFVAIYGESGSGKSTFMNVVGGLDTYQSGLISIEGEDISKFTSKSEDYYRNRKVGFIFQEFNLLENLSIIDNVCLPMTIAGVSRSEAVKRAKELLVLVGLKDHMKKRANQLSGGQKQRVAIARALGNDPDIILADEPTGALDTQTTHEILLLLQQIASQGKCIICITHSEKVSAFATRIVTLENGKLSSNNAVGSAVVDTQFQTTFEDKKQDRNKLGLSKAFKIGYKNLMSRKFRTFLICIGVSLGVTGSLLITSLSTTVTNQLEQTFAGVEIDETQTNVSVSPIDYMQESPSANESVEILAQYFDSVDVKPNFIAPNFVYENYDGAEMYKAFGLTYRDSNSVTLGYGEFPSNEGEVYYDGTVTSLANTALMFNLKLGDITEKDLQAADSTAKNEQYYEIETFIQEQLIGATTEVVIGEETITLKVVGSMPITSQQGLSTSYSHILYPTTVDSNVYKLLFDEAEALYQENKLAMQSSFEQQISLAQSQDTTETDTAVISVTDETQPQQAQLVGQPSIAIDAYNYTVDFDTVEEAESCLEIINGSVEYDKYYLNSDDFRSYFGIVETIVTVITNIMLALILVSFIVSVFMVIVIVYISTIERKTEIGTLRAIGARKNDITNIFVSEGIIIGMISFFIAVLSSMIGIVLVNVVFWYISKGNGITPEKFFQVQLDYLWAAIIFGIVVFVMFLASIVPAVSASRQNPIDALREE